MHHKFIPCVLLNASLAIAASFSSCAYGQPGWKDHRDSAGFQVKLPEGWSAESAKDGHTVIHNGDGTLFAIVQPFKLGDGAAAEAISPLIRQMDRLFPQAQVSQTVQVSTDPDEAVAKVSFLAGGTPGQANVLCVLYQGSGMLYAIAGPSRIFATKRPALLQVLRSFKYTAAAGAASPDKQAKSTGPLSFTTWADPNEGMFTTQVPSGWHVFGGAYRFAPIDVRIQVSVVSPDGAICVQNGAAKLTSFVTPGPSSEVRGLHEGQQYDVNGITYTVLSYWSGSQLSQQFTEIRLKKDHPDLEVTGTKERPDLEEIINQKLAQGAGRLDASIGETDFTFTDHGHARQGACIGTTVQVGQPVPGMMWQAFPSFVTAPSDKMEVAWKVWQHLIDGQKNSPDWSSRQAVVTKQFNDLIIRNHEIAMQQLHDQYVKAVQRLDENFRGWDNVIAGTQDVRDPKTGQSMSVAAGHNYYWMNASGQVVGSDAYSRPDVNLTPLERF
jgi:hypothetical protein